MTSLLPSRSTATTSSAAQSESQRRPLCQRGDSPNARPVSRICGSIDTSLWPSRLNCHPRGFANQDCASPPDSSLWTTTQCDEIASQAGRERATMRVRPVPNRGRPMASPTMPASGFGRRSRQTHPHDRHVDNRLLRTHRGAWGAELDAHRPDRAGATLAYRTASWLGPYAAVAFIVALTSAAAYYLLDHH